LRAHQERSQPPIMLRSSTLLTVWSPACAPLEGAQAKRWRFAHWCQSQTTWHEDHLLWVDLPPTQRHNGPSWAMLKVVAAPRAPSTPHSMTRTAAAAKWQHVLTAGSTWQQRCLRNELSLSQSAVANCILILAWQVAHQHASTKEPSGDRDMHHLTAGI
jgi:hypothetical protein